MHCLSYFFIVFITPTPHFVENLQAELFVLFTAASPVSGAVLKQ